MVTREALEYLEVNLHTMHVVVAVQTQGRFGNGMGQEYAEVNLLEYWRPTFNSNMWVRWKDRSGKQVRLLSEEQSVCVPSAVTCAMWVVIYKLGMYSLTSCWKGFVGDNSRTVLRN